PGNERFAFDFEARKLAVLGGRAEAVYLEESNSRPRIGTPLEDGRAADLAAAAFRDAAWDFRLGARPVLRWNKLHSEIVKGRFKPARFSSMALLGKELWLATPAALLCFGSGTVPPQLREVVPLPPGQESAEVVEDTLKGVRVLGKSGASWLWDRTARRW